MIFIDNQRNFINWVKDNFIQALPKNNTVVMGNDSCHSIQEEGTKLPTSAIEKQK